MLYVAHIAPAAAARFPCVNATSFGFDVVPDVCSRSATSPAELALGGAPPGSELSSVTSGAGRKHLMPLFAATASILGSPVKSTNDVKLRRSIDSKMSSALIFGSRGQQIANDEMERNPINPSGPRGTVRAILSPL